MKVKHPFGRPPAGAEDVQRLTSNGRWVNDDGKPGQAFSARLPSRSGLYPAAISVQCRCVDKDGFTDPNCPMKMAMNRTCERWSSANGNYDLVVVAKSQKEKKS